MNKTEKQFKKYMESNIHVKDTYTKIIKRIDFNEEEENMFMAKKQAKKEQTKKKSKLVPILCTTGALGIAAVAVVGVATHGFGLLEKEGEAMVTVETAQSVPTSNSRLGRYYAASANSTLDTKFELVLDGNDKVISVRGCSDESKLVLYGEKVVGKDVNTAVDILLQASEETGFLAKGSVKLGGNSINISVTAKDATISAELDNSIKESVEAKLTELGVQATVQAKAVAKETVVKLAMECDPSLTKEEADKMTMEQLLAVVKLYHVQTAELYTEELDKLYTNAKEAHINIVNQEATQKVLDGMDKAWQVLISGYNTVKEKLNEGLTTLETKYYEAFVKSDSAYQKKIAEMRQKQDILLQAKLSIKTDSAEANFDAVYTASVDLKAVADALETLRSSVESTYTAVKDAVYDGIAKMDSFISILGDKISDELTVELEKAEKSLNKGKDKFFKEFEKKYGDDIKAYKNQLKERKAALKEASGR